MHSARLTYWPSIFTGRLKFWSKPFTLKRTENGKQKYGLVFTWLTPSCRYHLCPWNTQWILEYDYIRHVSSWNPSRFIEIHCIKPSRILVPGQLKLSSCYDGGLANPGVCCPRHSREIWQWVNNIITWFAVHCFSSVHCTQCIVQYNALWKAVVCDHPRRF